MFLLRRLLLINISIIIVIIRLLLLRLILPLGLLFFFFFFLFFFFVFFCFFLIHLKKSPQCSTMKNTKTPTQSNTEATDGTCETLPPTLAMPHLVLPLSTCR